MKHMETKSRAEYFKDLQVGDEVSLINGDGKEVITTVIKKTDVLIIFKTTENGFIDYLSKQKIFFN